MDAIESIKQAIQRVSTQDLPYSEVCVVSDIDTVNGTCICTPVDGSAVLIGVRLNADNKDGFKLIPKNNTKVIVTLINSTTGYLSMISEVDEIHLNGVNHNGLTKVAELTTKLNNLENSFNTHLTNYNAHLHSGGTIMGNTAIPTVPDTQNLTPTVQSDIENTTVKHGS